MFLPRLSLIALYSRLLNHILKEYRPKHGVAVECAEEIRRLLVSFPRTHVNVTFPVEVKLSQEQYVAYSVFLFWY